MALLVTLLAGALAAPNAPATTATTVCSDGGECEKPLGSYLLQTHAAQQPPQPSDPEMTVDMNGRQCHLCSMPLPERSDRRYLQRTDCGNQSVFEHPENNRKPLISFSRQGSNAYCELNIQKWCADAIYNRDFLFQAKAVDARTERGHQNSYNAAYCDLNGWLTVEIKALQHDFEGMKKKVYRSSQHFARTGRPSVREAEFIGSWTCAMGSAGCDMAYCAYSFCKLPGGQYGTYEDCEGWDPVRGMP
ncbi:unnamed protein product [Durusdinium trenchii]|uniref:Uncharacterized protein n=1 Tax=Durusdinium trenchii TaxID=1381693 RepID=A0ABP0JAP8_9DINO